MAGRRAHQPCKNSLTILLSSVGKSCSLLFRTSITDMTNIRSISPGRDVNKLSLAMSSSCDTTGIKVYPSCYIYFMANSTSKEARMGCCTYSPSKCNCQYPRVNCQRDSLKHSTFSIEYIYQFDRQCSLSDSERRLMFAA